MYPEDLFLEEIYQKCADGNTDDATFRVLFHVDSLLQDGEYGEVDRLLVEAQPARLNTFLLRTFLSATAPAKEHLPSRPGFFTVAYERMTVLKGVEMAERLLGPLR